MEISRTFSIQAPRELVWSILSSPEEVGRCFPGCEEVRTIEAGRFKAVVGVRVGPINTKFNLEVETVEAKSPEFAAYSTKGEEGGRASHITARTTLLLVEAAENRTDITYQSSLQVVGRLGKFAGGLMTKLAASLSDEFIERLRARLAS